MYTAMIILMLPASTGTNTHNRKREKVYTFHLGKPSLDGSLVTGELHAFDEAYEMDSTHPLNHADVSSRLLPLTKPWGTVYSHRIACMVLSLWPDRKEKWDLIIDTWGPGCTELFFVLDLASNGPKEYRGFPTISVSMDRVQGKVISERNIWEKVHRLWAHVYRNNDNLLRRFDWFIKADDDTFVVTENMHGFLQYYDPSDAHYLGHTLRSRWRGENLVFNSGVCYALSRGALLKVGPYLSTLPTLPAKAAKSHCIDREGAGEDPTMGLCMSGVGVRPGNSLDHFMRERFLIFRPEDHRKILREDTWYWKYKPASVKEGVDCCSPLIVCMHNYKSTAEAKVLYPQLMKTYNQPKDWSKIPLPPRPRTFVYDKSQIDFEMDEYFNTKNPPRGQRIFKGVGKEWQCWRCDFENPNDLYWTPWWDSPGANHSVHGSSRYNRLSLAKGNP